MSADAAELRAALHAFGGELRKGGQLHVARAAALGAADVVNGADDVDGALALKCAVAEFVRTAQSKSESLRRDAESLAEPAMATQEEEPSLAATLRSAMELFQDAVAGARVSFQNVVEQLDPAEEMPDEEILP